MNTVRRTTLSMAALALVLVAYDANAGKREQRSVDAHARGTVTISNTAGSVEVRGWSRSEVQVDADLGWDVEELVVDRDGDDVLVKVVAPKRRGRSNISSELVIRVPEGNDVEVGVVSADIESRDVYGEQDLHSVSGDVELQAFEADISVETVSGDIEILGDGKSTHSEVTSVSGDIVLRGLSGDLDTSTVSGDLTVAEGEFDRAMVNTVNGDIVLRAGISDRARLDLETINGRIDINFEGDVNARFDIESFNGSIRNCFGPEAVRTSKYTPGRSLKFSEGDGSARVTVRTLNGSFRMCR